jgi:hypothetical protein
MATADMSAPLRQGIFLIGRPKQWMPAFRDQFKYFFNEKSYQGLMDTIKPDPAYLKARDAKLALTDMSPMLLSREETFMSNLAEKIPGFGRLAKASNRAYSGFLNKLRFDTFKDLLKNAEELGITKERPGVIADIGKFVNSATGRGNLGALERAAPVLNGAFFSPRLMASRLNLLNPMFYAKLDPFVRKEALKSLFTFAATATTVLTLAKLAGAEVKTDASSDFGKIKVGKTRFDMTGGTAAYITFLARFFTGSSKSSVTDIMSELDGKGMAKNKFELAMDFLTNKASPFASLVRDYIKEESFSGKKISLDSPIKEQAKYLAGSLIPLLIRDSVEAFKQASGQDSPIMGTAGFAASLVGIGVNTYEKEVNWNNKDSKEMKQFKDKIGQDEFNKANEKFNKEFNTWLDKIILDGTYEKLSNDDKKRLIQETSNDIKKSIFKEYRFKPKDERKTPLPRELKYRKSS